MTRGLPCRKQRPPRKGESPTPGTKISDLKGTWTGTYGPFSQPAKLVIKNQQEKKFDGVLEQGSIRVAFSGSVRGAAVKMKQSAGSMEAPVRGPR